MEKAQIEQKRWFDKKKSVKKKDIKVGDIVRIKSPIHIFKGYSKFGPPVKIIKVCGNAVKVENGNWWIVCRVVKITQREHNLYKRRLFEGSSGDGESQRQIVENLNKPRARRKIIKPARYCN